MPEPFTMWIDNDACPAKVRELIFKASKRVGFKVIVVANRYMHPPAGISCEIVCVGQAFDAADDYIAQHVAETDLVVTADIPLAARVVAKGATAFSPRGELFDDNNVGEKLASRNLNQDLRSMGEISGGPPAFGPKDIGKFAGLLDRLVAKAR